MNCHTCSRPASDHLPFYCATCACNQLYLLRYENARVLLEKDAVEREIEAAAGARSGDGKTDKAQLARSEPQSLRWKVQSVQTRQAQSANRIQMIRARMEELKAEIEEQRAEIKRRRSLLRQRRSDAESANYQLASRRESALSSVWNSIKRSEYQWDSLHVRTAESRIFLCREAANVLGLRRKLRKKKDDTIVEIYTIGGVPIVDLRNMNGSAPSLISTGLANVARLLVLVSHYLSLRLPAEVTLPHRDYPTPTIFTREASYKTQDPRYPGIKSPSQSGPSSPTASNASDRHSGPLPRPLYIDKSLPKLAQEDPASYGLFIEAVSLLAWDVSWLCRTQGLQIESDSWEDMCNMGKNLWQLLVAPPTQNVATSKAASGLDFQTSLNNGKEAPKTSIQRTKTFPIMGHYSHGTAHSFLETAEGREFMRSWKLPSPTKLADELKSTLLSEMANAEWELLEEKEWDDREAQDQNHGANNNAGAAASNGGTGKPEKPRGTSGWTKLKTRHDQ
ncbi:hypothetical protein VTN49DRAFT_6166 [Thermomyces lanuginosus]|uniref:uncharacterized protein n=1 Tax=Thermomyces lanuginosus TaxID=5541 RepID=UPI0037434436